MSHTILRSLVGSLFLALLPCCSGGGAEEPVLDAIGQAVSLEEGVTRTRYTYKKAQQGPLDLFVYRHDSQGADAPVMVFFHGGRWEEGHPKQFQPHSVWLAQRGIVTVSADYRVEDTHGTTPIEAALDAKSAIRWVRDNAGMLGIDPERVAAGGGSAGGHIATCAATIPELDEDESDTAARPDALVLFSTLVDTIHEDGLCYSKLGERSIEVSPWHHLSGDEPPTLILHGIHDETADIEASRRFDAALRANGIRSELVEYDAGHGFFNEFTDAAAYADTLRRTERFFEALGWIEPSQETRRPHVVLVLADDMGMGDLGAYNADSKIPTPALDAIAAAGVRFTDAHSPSAVCTPTRYGVLTGRYAWRTHMKKWVLNGYSPLLIEEGRSTLASLAQAQGYWTKAVGKWHLGLGDADRTDYEAPLRPGPLEVGFDDAFLIPASLDMPPYLWVDGDAPEAAATETTEASAHRRQDGGGFWRAGPIAPGFTFEGVLPRIGAESVATIREHARERPDRPLFLYVPLTAPHTPWVPNEPYHGASEAGWYGDFMAEVDATIGAIAAALDETGMADETLLLVTSDNGSHWPDADVETYGHDANLGLRGQKADIWEGGHRVPFLARWPERIAPDTECHELIGLIDLFATLSSLFGHELADDEAEDSFDVLPLLLGRPDARTPHDELVLHSGNGFFALREGDWKWIDRLGSGGFSDPRAQEATEDGPAGQLYHLGDDPDESENLWLAEPERVEAMRARVEAIRAGTGMRLP